MKVFLKLFPFLALGILTLLYYFTVRNFLLLKLEFSWVTSDVLTRVIVIGFISIGLCSLISLLWKKGNSILISVIAIATAFGVSFYNPIYIDDYGVKQSENLNIDFRLINKHFPNLIEENNEIVVAFFTSTCPYCQATARNFYANKKANKQPKTVIMFPSIKEDAERFLNKNKVKFDYALISDEEFVENVGYSVPSVFLIKNGKVENNWVGSEINYSVLDYLRDLAD